MWELLLLLLLCEDYVAIRITLLFIYPTIVGISLTDSTYWYLFIMNGELLPVCNRELHPVLTTLLLESQ